MPIRVKDIYGSGGILDGYVPLDPNTGKISAKPAKKEENEWGLEDNNLLTSEKLTPEQETKLARYDKLHCELLPDNWPEKYNELLNNQKPNDYEEIKKDNSEWRAIFPKPLTPQEVKSKYDEPKGIILTAEQQEKLNIPLTKQQWDTDYFLRPSKADYEALKSERDNLLRRLNQKPKDDNLSQKVAEEINKAYKAPKYLFSYYLKLMNTFKDWEIGCKNIIQLDLSNLINLEKISLRSSKWDNIKGAKNIIPNYKVVVKDCQEVSLAWMEGTNVGIVEIDKPSSKL